MCASLKIRQVICNAVGTVLFKDRISKNYNHGTAYRKNEQLFRNKGMSNRVMVKDSRNPCKLGEYTSIIYIPLDLRPKTLYKSGGLAE